MGVKYSNLFFTRLNSRSISYRIQSLYKPDLDGWAAQDKRIRLFLSHEALLSTFKLTVRLYPVFALILLWFGA